MNVQRRESCRPAYDYFEPPLAPLDRRARRQAQLAADSRRDGYLTLRGDPGLTVLHVPDCDVALRVSVTLTTPVSQGRSASRICWPSASARGGAGRGRSSARRETHSCQRGASPALTHRLKQYAATCASPGTRSASAPRPSPGSGRTPVTRRARPRASTTTSSSASSGSAGSPSAATRSG